MEVCSLIRAYETWIEENEHLIRGIDNMHVLLVGCTVGECAALARKLAMLAKANMAVEILHPLGDANQPYRLILEPSASPCHSIKQHVEDTFDDGASAGKSISISCVEETVALEDLPEHSYDLVVFGPLAFGILHGGAGSYDPHKRLKLIETALARARENAGKVLFCSRERTGWQELLFEEHFDGFGERFAEMLSDSEGGKIHYRHFPLQSELLLPAAISADQTFLDILLAVNSYCKYRFKPSLLDSIMGILAAESKRRHAIHGTEMKSEDFLLEERAAMFVVARSELPGHMDRIAALGETETLVGNARGMDNRESADGFSPWWPQGRDGDFFNCGLDLWIRQREEWRKAKGTTESTPPAPIPYEEVIAGLASMRRTYELPQPIRLSDIIDIYLDIWESQDGY